MKTINLDREDVTAIILALGAFGPRQPDKLSRRCASVRERLEAVCQDGVDAMVNPGLDVAEHIR